MATKTNSPTSLVQAEGSVTEHYNKYRALKTEIQAKLTNGGESLDGIRFSEDDFKSLEGPGREAVIAGLEKINGILESSISILGKNEGHFYVRSALKKFGYKVDNSIFETIRETDVIEIWGSDFLLKVANMNFIRVCSYSFEQVLSHAFWELFHRDPSLTNVLVSTGERIFRGQSGIVKNPIPPHIVREIFSGSKRQFWVEPQMMAPVLNSTRQIEAAMLVFRVTSMD